MTAVSEPRRVLVTGGAGFIGSAVIRAMLVADRADHVINVDKLTYAGNPRALADVQSDPRYAFVRADIADRAAMRAVFDRYRPDAVLHLAAETHVDRSIDGPADFMNTNVLGTFVLLEQARRHLARCPGEKRDRFRFLHVSTDEVYGDLGATDRRFSEDNAYRPNSPYSASKAASDHFARAWWRTYGVPVIVTNCSNNYGPWQFPEKLIPLMIMKALDGEALPVYGDGGQVRDWLHVDDHAQALLAVLDTGRPGETYMIGGNAERRNIDVVRSICTALEVCGAARPAGVSRFEDRICFVADRPGHDRRYAVDPSKIAAELGVGPRRTFEEGLAATVRWYLDNLDWCRTLAARYGGERLGLSAGARTAAE